MAGGLSLLAGVRPSRAQTALRRVGFLGISSPAAAGQVIEALKQGLRDFGWREGGNFEYRLVFAGSDESRLDGLVAELIGQKVEAIVAASAVTVRAAQRATKTIPIDLKTAKTLGLTPPNSVRLRADEIIE